MKEFFYSYPNTNPNPKEKEECKQESSLLVAKQSFAI